MGTTNSRKKGMASPNSSGAGIRRLRKTDITKVTEWYWKAAKRGVPHAQFVLGEHYEKGVGVAVDLDAAREMYDSAKKLGYRLGPKEMAPLEAEMARLEAAKKAMSELQGKWLVTAASTNGKPAAANMIQGMTFLIEGNRMTVARAMVPPSIYTFKLDSATKPKALDLDFGRGTFPGIYEVKGDTLTWCRSIKVGGERPKELTPKPNDGAEILTAKRAKP